MNWKLRFYAVKLKAAGEDQPVRKVEIGHAGVVRSVASVTSKCAARYMPLRAAP